MPLKETSAAAYALQSGGSLFLLRLINWKDRDEVFLSFAVFFNLNTKLCSILYIAYKAIECVRPMNKGDFRFHMTIFY